MKSPPYLSPGDRVAIVSPAGKIDRQVVERGAGLLRRQGFSVAIGKHACGRDGVFSGSDSARAEDMQNALDDESIRAIFFSRGGYGSLRTHLLLDWSAFLRRPKWLVGFSDITVFHSYLSCQRIASVHGVMTSWFEKDGEPTDCFLRMIRLLAGEPSRYAISAHELNLPGIASGILTGGNLSVIQSLRGTPLDIEPNGRILFIEDVGEYHYHLDRMMQNLKAGGVLAQLSGLVAGYFTGMKEGESPFGRNAYQIIREAVAPYRYPVAFGFPAGHEQPNHPLLMGSAISLEVASHGVRIETTQ